MNSQLNTISLDPARSPFDPNHPMNGRAPLNKKLRVGGEQAEDKKTSFWLQKSIDQEKESEDGIAESVKKHVTKVEDDRLKLKNMVSNSNRLLIGTKSIFPFDLFPNTINVEATRVNIIQRSLFYSEVHSVDIKDISNVFLSQSLFFAALVIVSRTFAKNEIKITKLWKKHAIEVRRIIEGLRMIVRADIDMNNYSVKELKNKLRELSTTKIVL